MAAKKQQQPKGNELEAQFGGFFGKMGSGKSYAMWLKHLEWQKRERLQVLCWSPKERHDNYAGRLRCKAYNNMGDLVRAARAGKNVVYVPSMNKKRDWEEFDLFNRLAHALIPCVLIVDEMSFITSAAGGTDSWLITCRMGRADGLRVLGSTQRPVHVDKDFYNAMSYAHVGQLSYEEDAKTVAKLVQATPAQVMALSGHNALTRAI